MVKVKVSKPLQLDAIPWHDPTGIDGLTVVELDGEEAEAQWLAAYHSAYPTKEARENAPTAPAPLGKP